MKLTSTTLIRSRYLTFYFLVSLILTLNFSKSYAQRVYANVATVKSNVVDNPNNAVNASGNFAAVKSYGGAALGLGKYSGELELRFPGIIPANKTTYIQIDFNQDVLNALLGGNLGSSLADLVGSLVLGNHYFEVGARNSSGTTLLSAASSGPFSSSNLKLVKDVSGTYYVAITPDQAYDRVYIKDNTAALLLGATNETKVYNAFYTAGGAACDPAFATDFDGNGLTVGLLGIGKAGVSNMEAAIDGDPSTASQIGLGVIGVAGTISQNIYFNTPSNPSDELNIKLQLNPSLVNVGLLNNIRISTYLGNNAVSSGSLSSLLNVDLLGLLNSGQAVRLAIPVGQSFDRVQVSLSSLLNVSLEQTVSLFSVTRSAPRPIFVSPQSNNVTTCYNSTATLSATTDPANQLIWYSAIEGGTALATTSSNGTFITPALTTNKTYYVAAQRSGCEESTRIAVNVSINPIIVFATTSLNNAAVGAAYLKQITAATGGTPTYTYQLAAGSALPTGLVLSATGQIGGIPTIAGDYSFNITAKDSKNCTATAAYSLKVTNALALAPATLPNGTVGSVYSAQTLPAATGGSTPFTYSVTNLPPGFNFDPSTRAITGTPTLSGTYTITLKATDAEGNSITRDYTLIIKDPLSLPSSTLVNGTVGVTYTTQVLLPATGGVSPYTYSASGLPAGLSFNPTTREITGTPTVAGNYNIVLTATDAEAKTATANYTLKVIDQLVLPSKILADGNTGVAYTTETIPAATGGVGPYTYAATGLPPGLNFNSTTRQINGTPNQAGNYTITVVATDSEGRTATNTYALKVNGLLSLPTATLPDGTVGDVYPTQTLPQVSGGTSPYTYVATNLPPGLTFNPTTRQISGTPTQGGIYTVSVTATDANNNKVNTDYVINVKVKAPILASASTCNGTSATITVSNAQPGVTYNLYAATGNTPIITNTSGIFSTGILNNNTTYYVEAASGSAVSSRTAINVIVNPSPNLPVITTNNQVINSGQSTTLQATADVGNTINWYNTATGGTIQGTGTSFTTPNLSNTTTYYASTVSSNGCSSINRVPVIVTVANSAGGPDCNAANAQTSGITGICLLCGITGPGNSTDGDKTNFTRITLSVGVAASGFQRLNFQSTGLATDSIRLDLATPTGLLDLSVLSGITINVMNGNTVVKTYLLNSSLIYLQLLGSNRFTATLPASAAFDRVEVSFAATVAALSSLDIYGAEIIYPKPTVSANGLSICSGSTTTLTATPNGGTTLTWYSAAIGGNILASGNSFTTPALTANTTYYIQVSRAGCANSGRLPVTVNVTPVLNTPTVAAAATSCEGSGAVLSVTNPDPTITYKWYEVATGGTAVFTGVNFTTPALSGNKIYYVEATKNTCVSANRAAVNINISPRPVLPQVQTSSTTVSPGQTVVLTASSTDASAIFKWYTTANGGTAIYTGATYVTQPLNSTTSYYVEALFPSTGCVSSSRVLITINVDGGAPNPVPCESAVTQSNGVNGIALLAGVNNPDLAIDDDSKTASTLVMPVGVLGASAYQRLGFTGVSNIGDTVRVLITSPGKLLSLGLLSSVELSTLNSGVANNDGVASNNALINLELLTGNTQAILTFVPSKVFDAVEIKLNAGLVGALSSLGINYAQRILMAPEVNSNNVSACLNQPVTLSVKNPKANLTYKWYNAAGVYQAGKDGVSFTTLTITSATKFYVAAGSTSGCISYKTTINVNITAAPVTPELVAPSVTTCTGSSVILQVKNPVVGITYKWYDGNGNYLAGKDGTSFTIASVTANATYMVEAANSCGNVSTKATATVKAGTLDLPILNPTSLTVTSGSPAVLTATSSTAGAVISWYATATSTTALATGSTFITPPLTTTTTYYAEAVVPGGCPASGRAAITITVVPNGNPVNTPCGSATVAIADGVNGVALLAGVFNANLAVDDKVETGSSLVMPIGVLGSYVYQRIGFAGGLSNVGDTLRIRISSPGKLLSLGVLPAINVITYNGSTSNNDLSSVNNPLISLELLSDNSAAIITYVPSARYDGVEIRLNSGLIGALTTINLNYAQRINASPQVSSTSLNTCQGTSTMLSIKNPITGITYKWYLGNVYQSGKDGAIFNTDASLSAGTYTYTVTSTANGCESVPTKITVVVLPLPTAPVASPGNPSSTCINTPVTLSVVAVNGLTYKWYDANGTLLVLNSNTYTTATSLAVGTYNYFVEATNGNNCSNSSRTKITITVGPSAVAADIQVNGSRSVCASSTTTLTASSTTVTNPVFTWYSNANLTNVVFTGAAFTTPVLSTNTTYYVTVRGDNKCTNAIADAAAIVLTINTPALASDINLSGQTTICAGNSAILTASSTTVTNPVFTWYSNAALTNIVFSGPVFTTPTLTSNIAYYVTVRGDNKCESNSANAKAVAIVVSQTSDAPIIATTGTTTCSGSTTTLSVQNIQAGATYEWYSAATGGTLLFTGATFTTPALTVNTDYYVQAVNSNGCANTSGRVKVTVTVGTRPAAPTLSSTTLSTCAGSTAVLTVTNVIANTTYTYYTSATGGVAIANGSTFTTPALNASTTYYVEASTGTCTSGSRTPVIVNVGAVLATPVISVQSKTTTSILFGWNAIAGAIGYEISTDGGVTWQTPSSGTNGTTHLVSGLTTNQSVTITVRAKGQATCQTSANATPITESITGMTNDLYIPNTFTPNGDGKNDVFHAYGNAISTFRMRVYNQWGEFMFESGNISNGWDGNFRGQMQPNGVYVYHIDVTFMGNTAKKMKGTVTLLR